jgi:hypothetical protein
MQISKAQGLIMPDWTAVASYQLPVVGKYRAVC